MDTRPDEPLDASMWARFAELADALEAILARTGRTLPVGDEYDADRAEMQQVLCEMRDLQVAHRIYLAVGQHHQLRFSLEDLEALTGAERTQVMRVVNRLVELGVLIPPDAPTDLSAD